MMDEMNQKAKLEALQEIMKMVMQRRADAYKKEAPAPEAAAELPEGAEDPSVEVEVKAEGEMPEDDMKKLMEMYSKMGA